MCARGVSASMGGWEREIEELPSDVRLVGLVVAWSSLFASSGLTDAARLSLVMLRLKGCKWKVAAYVKQCL